MLITFSGLDGSGKSTLVDHLKQSLEKDNQKVAVSHLNYDLGIYSLLRFLATKISRQNDYYSHSSHAPREQAYDGKFSNPVAKLRYKLVWNKGLRFVIYPVDVLIFLIYRFYVERVKQQVLIMDRYFYDTLVDVTGAHDSYRRRFLSRLTPAPNLPIYLDVSAEQAFERKQEYSVDYLSRRRMSYQKLISELPDVLVLSTENDLDMTRHNVVTAIRERLGSLG